MNRWNKISENIILKLSFYLQLIVSIYIILIRPKNIFTIETILILNFAFFYIYLHYLNYLK